MITNHSSLRRALALLPLLFLFSFFAAHTFAQGQRGAGAGIGGNVGAGARGAVGNNTTTRQYFPNGTIGDAVITSDPESRRLIVITDEETAQHVGQVITNLDRPKPQVLI